MRHLLILFTILLLPVITHADTGLDFSGDANGARMHFLNPHTNGLPAYNGATGNTYIFKVYPRPKCGYFTTFFWSGLTLQNASNYYYGAHPYPVDGYDCPGGNTDSNWEISINTGDYIGDSVVYNQWYTQALLVYESGGTLHHEFYYNLPDETKLVHRDTSASGLSNPTGPAVQIGGNQQAAANEQFNGVIRGIQIYNSKLSLVDIYSEIATPKSTTAGAASAWYINVNPTVADITDKSGAGHDFSWANSTNVTTYSGGSTPAVTTGRRSIGKGVFKLR